MSRAKWYSPQLSREIVSRLYFRAKAERIPMTILANRLKRSPLSGLNRASAKGSHLRVSSAALKSG